MGIIQFVRNYQDLSTERGYQFRFDCDRCGNGYLSNFKPSVLGAAGGFLRAAGSMLGSWGSQAASSSSELQRTVGGKEHDSALATAVQEGKSHFRQCSRCASWACPEVCWNAAANLCVNCAPKFEVEMASAQALAKASAGRAQMQSAAYGSNYSSGIDMGAGSVLHAPEAPQPSPEASRICGNCGSSLGTSKFCPECGTPAADKQRCGKCGFTPATPMKFCPECGGHL